MAWYEVTLEGFKVNAQTWDDALNRDGWADEVYIYSTARVINQVGTEILSLDKTSDVMGDTIGHNGRVQAGSAIHWPDTSQIGGLQTGDEFPYPDPWTRPPGQSLEARKPPMLLWSGELKNDDEAVVIMPTIWEWDGGSSLLPWWSTAVANNVPHILEPVVRIIAAVKGNLPIPADFASEIERAMSAASHLELGLMGDPRDRPIGMVKNGDDFTFTPKALTLTSTLADRYLDTDIGYGQGVLEIVYQDDPILRGNYSLFIKVTKFDPVARDGAMWKESSSPAVNITYGGAKFSLASPEWVDRYGGMNRVTTVSDGALGTIPLIPRNGTILREWSGSSVFVILNGQKCSIPTPEALNRYSRGRGRSGAWVVPDGTLGQIPSGPDAPEWPEGLPRTPRIVANADNYDFGRVNLGTPADFTFRVSNQGGVPLTISSVSAQPEPEFGITTSLPTTINPFESKPFGLRFTPIAEQFYSGRVSIASNADNQPNLVLALGGQGADLCSELNAEMVVLQNNFNDPDVTPRERVRLGQELGKLRAERIRLGCQGATSDTSTISLQATANAA